MDSTFGLKFNAASVLVIGEALIDLVNNGDQETAHPGGSPFNVASGLGQLGFQVNFHTSLGIDSHSRVLQELLKENGVAVSDNSSNMEHSSKAYVNLSEKGEARYSFDIEWNIAPPAYKGEALVHIGSIAAFLAPGAEAVATFLESLPSDVQVSFDPNIRSQIIGDVKDNFSQFERIASRATIIKMSEEDSSYLFPRLSPAEVTKHLIEKYRVKLAVVTLGEKGAVASSKNLEYSHAAKKAEVVDTIGAGDSFTVGLISALLEWPHSFAKLTFGSFEEIDFFAVLNFATECAAFTVSRAGAVMPNKNDSDFGIIK